MKKIFLLIFSLNLLASEAKIALELAKVNDYLLNIKQCSENNFQACNKLSGLGSLEYINEVKSFINDECKVKNMSACYVISDLSDDIYTKYNALRLACQNHFDLACTKLIIEYEKNSTKALKILKNQCDKEYNQNSCFATAKYYKGFLDKENAIKYSHHACSNNFYNSCLYEASIYYEENNTKKAIEILENTCDKGYEEACFAGANTYISLGQFKLSKKFLEKSCELGNKLSCNKLSGF